MSYVPYIDEDTRELHRVMSEEAFRNFVGDCNHNIRWKSWLGTNAVELRSFGDAVPNFDSEVHIDALVEHKRTDQNHSAWGDDERVVKIIHILVLDVENFEIDNRGRIIMDRVEIDGTLKDNVEFQVIGRETPEGLGHETWTTILKLAFATQ